MTKIQYKSFNFRDATILRIEQCNRIIDNYLAQGYILTVRQLYYRLVATGKIENNKRTYKQIVETINKGRLAGLISWEAIEDRTRYLRENSHWSTPGNIVAACAGQFALDHWRDQKFRPEVWIEKDAFDGRHLGDL